MRYAADAATSMIHRGAAPDRRRPQRHPRRGCWHHCRVLDASPATHVGFELIGAAMLISRRRRSRIPARLWRAGALDAGRLRAGDEVTQGRTVNFGAANAPFIIESMSGRVLGPGVDRQSYPLEVAHYLFNAREGDAATGSAPGELASAAMRVRMWGVDPDEPHRDALAPGDLVLIYLGAPERVFIGSAELASAVHDWTSSEALLYPGDSPSGVSLAHVEEWDPPGADECCPVANRTVREGQGRLPKGRGSGHRLRV